MSHVKTFFPVRAISGLACAAALLLSACGGSDSTSNRNGRLNSVLCFDTQDLKDQAIADAEKALTEAQATQPLLEDASSNGASSRVDLAFIGPRLWWMQFAVEETTTTSTTSTTIVKSSETTVSITDSTDVSSDTTVPTTNSTDVSTETSIPLVGDMVLQQLQDALNAATNAPLCDATDSSTAGTMVPAVEMVDTNCDINFRYDASINYLTVTACDAVTKMRFVNGSYAGEANYSSQKWFVQGGTTESYTIYIGDLVVAQGDYNLSDGDVTVTGVYQSAAPTAADTTVDTTVATGSTNTCTATVTSNGASFTCARELVVNFFYFLEGGNDQGSLSGNQDTVFGPIENVRDIYLSISSGVDSVFSQFANPGTYEFEVPPADVVSEPESDEPYFSGDIDLSEGDNSVSFTVPDDYSLQDLWLDLTFECEIQEIEASVSRQGVYMASFVDPGFPVGLPEGVCLINLYITGSEFLVPGETYDVVITSETDAQITWGGTVELEGDGVSFGEEPFYEPYFYGVFDPTTGEDTVTFTIPKNYSAWYFSLELYADCEDQEIEATLLFEAGVPFENMADFNVLGDGLCGVWLRTDNSDGIPRGETFEVVIRTDSNAQIAWSGTVALEGDGVTRFGDTVTGDQGLVWEELFNGEIDAEQYMTIEIPEGGRQVDVRAITTRFENQEDYVDPYLVIFDDTEDVVARNNDGGEDYGYGDYSSRLYVFLEEGSYTLLATTYDLWFAPEELWPTIYDLELRVGSVPVPADQVAPSGDSPEEQQVQVEVLDASPSNLEEPKPVFELPVNEVINRDKSSNEPNPVIPAGVTEVVCDSGCLLALREAAGVSEGVVTIQVGGEVIEVQPGVRNAIIPVRPTAKEIQVTVTPTDGGEPVVLSTEVLVISPRTFPTKMAEGAKSVVKTKQGSEGLPTNLIVVLSVLALAIAIGLVRRNKVRIPE